MTKSPFLFNAESFSKMRKELNCEPEAIMKLLLEIVSYKLELNVSLVMAMYSKYRNSKDQ